MSPSPDKTVDRVIDPTTNNDLTKRTAKWKPRSGKHQEPSSPSSPRSWRSRSRSSRSTYDHFVNTRSPGTPNWCGVSKRSNDQRHKFAKPSSNSSATTRPKKSGSASVCWQGKPSKTSAKQPSNSKRRWTTSSPTCSHSLRLPESYSKRMKSQKHEEAGNSDRRRSVGRVIDPTM
jgi:hypothetical protein